MKFKHILLLILLIIFIFPYTKSYSATSNLSLDCMSAILIDMDTGYILYEKHSKEKMYPASTTKILSSIIILENCGIDEKVTATTSAISQIPAGYSSAYIVPGEILTVNELLTLFLVHSANEAGYILAEYYAKSIDNFATLMNNKAKEIGCQNSNFLNPSGLHDDNHYTTAYDLSLIASYCMKNDIFRSIVSMKNCTIPATNKSNVRKYSNSNSLITPNSKFYIEECTGIKTGTTTQAKNCLISAFSKNNLNLICVVLGSSSNESRYKDSHTLFEYGYKNYAVQTVVNKNDILSSIEISNGTKETRNVDLILEDEINALVNLNKEIPEPVITLNNNLSAPISEKQILGTASYTINDITYTRNLLASHDVEKDNSLLILFGILLVTLIILILIIIIILKYKKKKKNEIIF